MKMATGQSPSPGQSPSRSEAPLALVTPVKRSPRWNAICGQKPPYVKSPHAQNVLCLFSL